jgi:hypothetical protein
MGSLLALSGLMLEPAQYDFDGKLMKARGLLLPEERPTVPVQVREPGFVVGMSNVISRKDNKPLAIRLRKEAGMAVPKDRDRIIVNRQSVEYKSKDLRQLAAQLGHEQSHVRGADERAAYPVQMNILKRLGVTDRKLYEHLKHQMELHGGN